MPPDVAVRIDAGVGGGYGPGVWSDAVGTWAAQTRTWDGPWRYEGDWVDVAPRTSSVVVRRGRQDETESYGFGSSRILLQNLEGYFDPDSTFPLRLRQPIEVRSATYAYGAGSWAEATGTWADQTATWLGPAMFTGFVEDVDLRYDVTGTAEVDLACVDGLSILSNQSVVDLTVPLEDSGARIDRVLAAEGVNYPGATSVEAGLSLLAAGTANANVTEYLRQAELSEQGRLYVDREGTLVFRNRRQTFGTPYVFADDGTGTYYTTVERFSGARALFNRVIGRTPDGTVYFANSTRSQDEFNVRTRDLGVLLASSVTTVLGLIAYVAGLYSKPETRAYAVGVVVDRLDRDDQYALLALDLASPADVKFTPPGVSQFTTEGLIQGIEHRMTVGTSWTTRFYLERRPGGDVLTLDDPSLGRLDLNELTF